MYNYLEKFIS